MFPPGDFTLGKQDLLRFFFSGTSFSEIIGINLLYVKAVFNLRKINDTLTVPVFRLFTDGNE